MDYTTAILWYASWPVLIYVAYRFVLLNLRHHAKMERLEMLEERFGHQCEYNDALIEAKEKQL
ncbi:hypothetical protein [Nitratifractor sp.]